MFGRNISRFMRDERGATAIEYGLLASLVAVAIIAATISLGNKIGLTFNKAGNKLSAS